MIYILAYTTYDNPYIEIASGNESDIIDIFSDMVNTENMFVDFYSINDVIAYIEYKFVGNDYVEHVTILDNSGNTLAQA